MFNSIYSNYPSKVKEKQQFHRHTHKTNLIGFIISHFALQEKLGDLRQKENLVGQKVEIHKESEKK